MALQPTNSEAEMQADHVALLCSDDECVQRLAALIEDNDSRNLGEIARLIGRLSVPIE